MVNDALFSAQIERIKLVTGKQTYAELANFLGIRQSSVSAAVQRGKIPSSWLVTLMCTNNIRPEWILTGTGPCYSPAPPKPGHYENGEQFYEDRACEEALRRLPSWMLAEELVRRIAVSQQKAFCSKN